MKLFKSKLLDMFQAISIFRLFNSQFNFLKVISQRKGSCQPTPQNKPQKLKSKELDFQALVETTNVIILIFQDNNICYANLMLKKITGYTKEELFNDIELSQKFYLTKNQEVSFLKKNGDLCWLDCSICPTQFARQPATLVTAVDITKYRYIEEQDKDISQPEYDSSESLVELTSMISHELRTPLNVIALSHNLLQRYYNRWGEEKRQEYLDRIKRSIETMSLMIDEVSIVGKAEAQKLKFEPQLLEANEFCQTLLSDLYLANDRVRLINFHNLGACGKVWLDHNLLQLILTNLLENAIKYSPQDKPIDFTLTVNDDDVAFKIQDRGIGITVEDRQQLFEPFYRGSNVGKLPGTGLGLNVVKKLVDVHDGSIAINSQVGVGTEVIVSLPKKTSNFRCLGADNDQSISN